VGQSTSLIGQIVGTSAKGHVRAVPRVAESLETGRFEAVEAGGYSVPRDSRYSCTSNPTRDSAENIHIWWRLKILKSKKSVHVWFGSKVKLYLIH